MQVAPATAGNIASRKSFLKQGAPLEPLKHGRMCYKQVVPLELLLLSVDGSGGVACL